MKKPDTTVFDIDLFLKPANVKHPDGTLIRGSMRAMKFTNQNYASSGASSLAHNYSSNSTRVNIRKYN